MKTTDPLEFASWHAAGHTPTSCKAPPHQCLHQHEAKYFAFYQTISPVLASFSEKLSSFERNKHEILDTDKVEAISLVYLAFLLMFYYLC